VYAETYKEGKASLNSIYKNCYTIPFCKKHVNKFGNKFEKFYSTFALILKQDQFKVAETVLETVDFATPVLISRGGYRYEAQVHCNIDLIIKTLIIPLEEKNLPLFKLLDSNLDSRFFLSILLHFLNIPIQSSYTVSFFLNNSLSEIFPLLKDKIECLITCLKYIDEIQVTYMTKETLNSITNIANSHCEKFPELKDTIATLKLFNSELEINSQPPWLR